MRWINELAGLARPSLMFARDALPARTPKEEIVKTMLFAAAAFAVAGFAAPAFADNASPRTDEVRASFDRMLGHQADPRTAAKVDREADPLRKAVVAAQCADIQQDPPREEHAGVLHTQFLQAIRIAELR